MTEHQLEPHDPHEGYCNALCTCGAAGSCVDHAAAEVWHALHVRWPGVAPGELGMRMHEALRHPTETVEVEHGVRYVSPYGQHITRYQDQGEAQRQATVEQLGECSNCTRHYVTRTVTYSEWEEPNDGC